MDAAYFFNAGAHSGGLERFVHHRFAFDRAVSVLSLIYRIGRPGRNQWEFIVPGAAVATVLWWVVSISLGFYLRRVPYSLIYGGLAVTIGLMLWMQLTATILLIGAAYNAELLEDSSN